VHPEQAAKLGRAAFELDEDADLVRRRVDVLGERSTFDARCAEAGTTRTSGTTAG